MSRKKTPPPPPPPPAEPNDNIIKIAARGGRRMTTWTTETRPKSTGRRKGGHDKVPRTLKKSIVAICQALVSAEPELIHMALRRGLKARPPHSFPYLQLAAAYIDGRPAERIKIEAEVQLQVSQASVSFKSRLEQVAVAMAEAALRKREEEERQAHAWILPANPS